jgi:hypothetical protein
VFVEQGAVDRPVDAVLGLLDALVGQHQPVQLLVGDPCLVRLLDLCGNILCRFDDGASQAIPVDRRPQFDDNAQSVCQGLGPGMDAKAVYTHGIPRCNDGG